MDETYLETAYDQYLMVSAEDKQFHYTKTPNGQDNIIKSLYTDTGKGKPQL